MYTPEYWDAIVAGKESIPFKIQATLINDAFYFFTNGAMNYNIMFRFLKWLKGETRIYTWIAVEPIIMEMNRRWLFTDLHEPFLEIIRHFIKEFYLSRDDHNSSLPIQFACWAQLPECLKDSQEQLMEFISGPQVNFEMHMDTILCGGMRAISSEIFQHIIQLGRREFSKRDILLMAMCCIERPVDVELFIRSIFTRNEFPISTDMKYMLLLNIFMSSYTGAEVAWRFIDRRHEFLFSLFGRRRFQEMTWFLAAYLKRLSQLRAMKLMYHKFDFEPTGVFERMMRNRLRVDRDFQEKYDYLTEVIFKKTHL